MNRDEVFALMGKAKMLGLRLPDVPADQMPFMLSAWHEELAPYTAAQADAAMRVVGARSPFLNAPAIRAEIECPTVPKESERPRWQIDRAHYLAHPEPDAPTCETCGLAYRHGTWCPERDPSIVEPFGMPAFCYPPNQQPPLTAIERK